MRDALMVATVLGVLFAVLIVLRWLIEWFCANRDAAFRQRRDAADGKYPKGEPIHWPDKRHMRKEPINPAQGSPR